MKHFRILLPILILAVVLSGCGSTSREPYEYTYSGSSGTNTITVNPESQTILDGTDVYHYTAKKSGSGMNYDITYPNGGTYWWMATNYGGHGGWSEDYDENRYIQGDILVHALEQNQPRQKTGNFGIGLLLIALGMVNFFLPVLPFYLRYGWAVENAEPSDAYITMTKFGGILAAVVGLVWCIV